MTISAKNDAVSLQQRHSALPKYLKLDKEYNVECRTVIFNLPRRTKKLLRLIVSFKTIFLDKLYSMCKASEYSSRLFSKVLK